MGLHLRCQLQATHSGPPLMGLRSTHWVAVAGLSAKESQGNKDANSCKATAASHLHYLFENIFKTGSKQTRLIHQGPWNT